MLTSEPESSQVCVFHVHSLENPNVRFGSVAGFQYIPKAAIQAAGKDCSQYNIVPNCVAGAGAPGLVRGRLANQRQSICC